MTRRERKRILLTAVTMLILAVMFFSCGNKVEFSEENYVVSGGETLWGLYSEYGKGADWEEWLHRMLDINDKGRNAFVYAGEEIILLTVK